MKFDMEDIDWKALDFFLEEVENGYYSKEELLNNENFLAMLAAVKYDKANWKRIPPFYKGELFMQRVLLTGKSVYRNKGYVANTKV